MPETVEEILDEEFRRLATELGKPELLRVRGQADFLGLSPGHLSRARRGEIGMSTKLADIIISRVCEDLGGQEQLRERLLNAATRSKPEHTRDLTGEAFVADVARYFEDLRRADCFLCIDYRDFPRSEQRAGRYPNLLDVLADAVRGGLVVAMFQPFCSEPVSRITPRGLEAYIEILQGQVRLVHKQLRALVAGGTDMHRRVVLYERKGKWAGGTGLGSRTMYAERIAKSGVQRTIHEWVVGLSYDTFVERDETQLWPEAFAEQFFPIVDFWRTNRELPGTDGDLSDYVKGTDWSAMSLTGKPPTIVWTVAGS